MNYDKIGNFITAERKAKNLTQAKLAEKLFVSEKTISKWENGKGIPDTNSLPKICEIFNVTINELLNGERLDKDVYTLKAEEKLLELQNEKEKNSKFMLRTELFLGFGIVVSFFLLLFASIYTFLTSNNIAIPIFLIVFDFCNLIACVLYLLKIEQVSGLYMCTKCEHKYVPTFKAVFFAPHINRSRQMKCPHCNKKTWHKKVIK